MKVKYTGNNISMRVAGILFRKGAEIDLNEDQAKALKADRFGKYFIDNGTLVEKQSDIDGDDAPESKLVADMKVDELETYIKNNGGEFASTDNKPELLIIAQAIEDAKNDKD